MNRPITILISYYQGTETDTQLQEMLDSLNNQTYKDFNVLIVHDGKQIRPWNANIYNMNVKFETTPHHENVWGHNTRDYGLHLINTGFVWLSNADNTFYPDATELLHKASETYPHLKAFTFGLKFMGINSIKTPDFFYMWNTKDKTKSVALNGNLKEKMDVMQVVLDVSLWQKNNYWHDKTRDSDSTMYNTILKKEPFAIVNEIIGEHR